MRQALHCTSARDEPGADLRLPENGALATCEADVARQCEFASAAACAAAYNSDAPGVAFGQALRGINPARNAEAAARRDRAVVRDVEVRVRAFERDDLNRGVCLDRLDQIVDLVVHAVVDRVYRRVVERHAPVAGNALVSSDLRRRLGHGMVASWYEGVAKRNTTSEIRVSTLFRWRSTSGASSRSATPPF